MKHAISILALATLAACGGGGDGGSPATHTASSTTPAPTTGTPSDPATVTSPSSTVTSPAPTVTTPPPQPVNVPAQGNVNPAPAPAPQPQAPSAPAADPAPAAPTPAAPASAPAPTPMCGPNQGGMMFPCDPRWPYPGQKPQDGATQDQVDGYDNMCTTQGCYLYRCADARVVPYFAQLTCATPATPGSKQ